MAAGRDYCGVAVAHQPSATMTSILLALAVGSAALALALRVWAWQLERRYDAAIREGVRLNDEWIAHREAGNAAFLDGEWDEQAAWEAAGLGAEWLKYSSY